MTQAAKERALRVLMYGLAEERRVCGMDAETWNRRCREALEQCELPAAANLNIKDTRAGK